jgi:signal transduction histidine kinase
MTNIQIYVLISIGCVLLIGGWSLYLAVRLDKARAKIKHLQQEVYNLRTPF